MARGFGRISKAEKRRKARSSDLKFARRREAPVRGANQSCGGAITDDPLTAIQWFEANYQPRCVGLGSKRPQRLLEALKPNVELAHWNEVRRLLKTLRGSFRSGSSPASERRKGLRVAPRRPGRSYGFATASVVLSFTLSVVS
jgi:hypothetical protein